VKLNERSREIFRLIGRTAYVADWRADRLAHLCRACSANTLAGGRFRNVMADLEEAGLLYAPPHLGGPSADRGGGCACSCTGLLELANLAEDERHTIEALCAARGKSLAQALEEATRPLSACRIAPASSSCRSRSGR